MIDPVTGWFEIVKYSYKRIATIFNLVYKAWICRYPITTLITYDNGNLFLGHGLKNYLINFFMGLSLSV